MASSLHPIERRVLSSLASGRAMDFDALAAGSGLGEDQLRRALQWLSTKGLVRLTETSHTKLEVVREPAELLLYKMVRDSPRPLTVAGLRSGFRSSDEFSAALGRARSSGWVEMEGKPAVVTATVTDGPAVLSKLLQSVAAGTDESSMDVGSRKKIAELEQRGVLKRTGSKQVTVSMTPAGGSAVSEAPDGGQVERLTPEMISSGAWKGKSLRPIDVEAKAPVFFPGRRHPVRDFIREVKEVYVSMGFTELHGDSVHPAFWNFDALYIPQDHPGREMQDTFYLEGLQDRKMRREGVVDRVASTHEGGWKTGSTGWGYTWKVEEAKRLLLRTHNTVLTVKALSRSEGKDTRVFAVSKVYRNENFDYKHLAEFHQMDGMIIGEGLTFRHLIGFLSEFYRKLGMTDVKLWPTYFPYTEPSLEVVGYSEVAKDWIELGGSGIFRPEVTWPLGVKVPVLAWGPGIERLMMLRYGLDDMRALYNNDIDWLRSRKQLASS